MASNKHLPPTRQLGLKPEDKSLNYDPLNLVKVHSNPLGQEAQKIMEVTEKQKITKKEDYNANKYDESTWENNLDQWKSKRRSVVRTNSESPEVGITLTKSPLNGDQSFVTHVNIGSSDDEIHEMQVKQTPEPKQVDDILRRKSLKEDNIVRVSTVSIQSFKPEEEQYEVKGRTKNILTDTTFSSKSYDLNEKPDFDTKYSIKKSSGDTTETNFKTSSTSSQSRKPFSSYDHFSSNKKQLDIMSQSDILDFKSKDNSSLEKASISKFHNIKSFFEQAASSSQNNQPQIYPRKKSIEKPTVEIVRKKSDSNNYSKNRMSLGPGVLENLSLKRDSKSVIANDKRDSKIAIANDKEYVIEEHVFEFPRDKKKDYRFTQDISSKYKTLSPSIEKNDKNQKNSNDDDNLKPLLRNKFENVEIDLRKEDKAIDRISMDVFENMIISPELKNDKKGDKQTFKSSSIITSYPNEFELINTSSFKTDDESTKINSLNIATSKVEPKSDVKVEKLSAFKLTADDPIEFLSSRKSLKDEQNLTDSRPDNKSGTFTAVYTINGTNKPSNTSVIGEADHLQAELMSREEKPFETFLSTKKLEKNFMDEEFEDMSKYKIKISDNAKRNLAARKNFFLNEDEDEETKLDLNRKEPLQAPVEEYFKKDSTTKEIIGVNFKTDSSEFKKSDRKNIFNDGEITNQINDNINKTLISLPVNEENVQYLSKLKANDSYEKETSQLNTTKDENVFKTNSSKNDPKTYVKEVFQMLDNIMTDGLEAPVKLESESVDKSIMKDSSTKSNKEKSRTSSSSEKEEYFDKTYNQKTDGSKIARQPSRETKDKTMNNSAEELNEEIFPKKSFKDKQHLINNLKLNERPSKPPPKSTPPQVPPKPSARTSLPDINQKKFEGISLTGLPKVLPTFDTTPLKARSTLNEEHSAEKGIHWEETSEVQKLDVSASRSKSMLSKHMKRRPPSFHMAKEGLTALSLCEPDGDVVTVNGDDVKLSDKTKEVSSQARSPNTNQHTKTSITLVEEDMEDNENNNNNNDVINDEDDEDDDVRTRPPRLPSCPPPPAAASYDDEDDDNQLTFTINFNRPIINNQVHSFSRTDEEDDDDDCLESSV